MKIGNLDLGKYPLLLAPMEDVTDPAFRLMCKRFGADMVYTEFVSSDALIRNVNKTQQKLHISGEERPVAIQIYGRFPDAMAEAAQLCEEAHPDVLDINFGCPVKKVAGKGAGAGMLRDIPKMLDITRRVVDAVKIPVTVKTRLGWDDSSRIIVDLAESLQDCGIAALAIHGRTRAQMYTGEADWSLIGAVKNNPRMRIPIIGNGDITSPEICWRRFDETGVDAVMIGRGSIGRPWIFGEIKHYLMADSTIESSYTNKGYNNSFMPHSFKWKLEIIKQQIEESVRILDERRGIIHIRRHLAATPIFKGIPNFRDTRVAMLRAETVSALFKIIDSINENQETE
jgi:tRNA-dihydrouridine synthase B